MDSTLTEWLDIMSPSTTIMGSLPGQHGEDWRLYTQCLSYIGFSLRIELRHSDVNVLYYISVSHDFCYHDRNMLQSPPSSSRG